MKKAIYLSCTLLLCASTIAGCSNGDGFSEESTESSATTLNLKNLTGTWNGIGTAIAQEDDYSVDSIQLTIEENGEYKFTDSGTEESLLRGTLSVASEDTLSFKNEELSYPLTGWETIEEEDTVQCSFLNSETIALSYDNTGYVFSRQDSALSDFSLLDQTVSDLWYSDDGSQEDSSTTYELSFNDTYLELYAITGRTEAQLLTSFFYEKNEGNTYSFYTYLNDEYTYPDVLSSVPTNTFTSVDITLDVEDNTLTLSLDGKEMSFYSNLIYGLETGSDAYELCDTSFQWSFDSVNHFCYFTMNPNTDTLYLYMADAESTEFATATVCGEIELDQDTKTITYHFDSSESSETSSSSEDIYTKSEEMDGKTFSYTLEDKALSIEIDDKTYNFTLEDY